MNKPISQIYATEIKMTPGTNRLSLASRMGWSPQLRRHILPHVAHVKGHGWQEWGRHDSGFNEKHGLLFIDLCMDGLERMYTHVNSQYLQTRGRKSHSLTHSHTQSYSIKIEWTVWKHKAQEASLVSYFKFPMIKSLSAFRE